MTDCDVAIVGGGPVGMLLGCLLSSRGASAVVFERGGHRAGSRAIGIHPPGLAALDAVSLGDEARAQARVIEAGVASCRGRVLASLPLHDVLALPQNRIERMLRSRLGRGALERGRPVLGIADEGKRVALDLGGRTIRARLAVAADGVHSTIRRQLGIGWRPYPGTGHYLMTDAPSCDDDPRAHLNLEPDGVVESFPLPDGIRRWVARVPHDVEATLADIVLARTGTRIPHSPTSAFSARQHRADSFRRGNVVLLGDAAHEVSPIGGQGMNLGWLGALRLAPVIVEALREGRGDFAAYERRMRAAALHAQQRARFNMMMGAPCGGGALAVRNVVARGFDAPPLRRALTRAFTMRGL